MLTNIEALKDCETRRDLAELLGVDVATLTYFAYARGKRYKTFTLPKKRGGVRTISAPVKGLVQIQRKLLIELEKFYPKPTFVQGFVKGGSIRKNAELHLNKRILLNIDLSDFFPSITAPRIIGLLKSKPFNCTKEVASVIAGLACNNGTLPQGAPTSPILSNMICLRMDRQLFALSRRHGVTYSRYADDLSFSTKQMRLPNSIVDKTLSNTEVVLGEQLRQIIRDNWFDVNPLKTRLSYGTKPKFVTGIKVNHYPNLTRKYVRQIRAMIHAWKRWGPDKAQADFSKLYRGSGRSFVKVVEGKLAHLKNVKGPDDLTFARLYNDFADLEAKGRPQLPIDAIEQLLSKVFVICSGMQQGTGFILDNRWLISCDHVIDGERAEYFNHNDFDRSSRKTIDTNTRLRSSVDKYDVIAIPLNPSDSYIKGKSLELAPAVEDVTIGKQYKVLGFPNYSSGSTPHMITVEVNGFRPDKNDIRNAYVNSRLRGGLSGSPVLNEKYQVVGIVQRGADSPDENDNTVGNTFLPIQELRKVLEEFSKAK